jgi:hypothetical protein
MVRSRSRGARRHRSQIPHRKATVPGSCPLNTRYSASASSSGTRLAAVRSRRYESTSSAVVQHLATHSLSMSASVRPMAVSGW